MAVGLMASSAAPGYGWLLVLLLLVGAGYSTAQPGGSKSVASWFSASQRGFAMGIRQAGLPLGGALAAAVLPWLAASYGWRAPLLASGILALTGGLVFMGFYRSPQTPPPSVTHRSQRAQICGESLARADPVGFTRRQVSDIPLVTVAVTEHRLHQVRCDCGHVTAAVAPECVAACPTSYGPNLRALAVYLLVFQHVPVERAPTNTTPRRRTSSTPRRGY